MTPQDIAFFQRCQYLIHDGLILLLLGMLIYGTMNHMEIFIYRRLTLCLFLIRVVHLVVYGFNVSCHVSPHLVHTYRVLF